MKRGALGKVYPDGEVIVRQGDVGDCMYVIQEGQVEVVVEESGIQSSITILGEQDFFGEMALFNREVRSATVRANGDVRVLQVDKKNFLSGISEDPSLAFRIIQTMSRRIRELTTELVQTNITDRREFRRIALSMPLSIKIDDNTTFEGVLHNVSLLGAHIQTSGQLEQGQQILLDIPGIESSLEAQVVHIDSNGEYGLLFAHSLGHRRQLLNKLVQQLK